MTTTDTRTRGQRWADAVTRFGGSWAFIGTFVLSMSKVSAVAAEESKAGHLRMVSTDGHCAGSGSVRSA